MLVQFKPLIESTWKIIEPKNKVLDQPVIWFIRKRLKTSSMNHSYLPLEPGSSSMSRWYHGWKMLHRHQTWFHGLHTWYLKCLVHLSAPVADFFLQLQDLIWGLEFLFSRIKEVWMFVSTKCFINCPLSPPSHPGPKQAWTLNRKRGPKSWQWMTHIENAKSFNIFWCWVPLSDRPPSTN